MKKKIADFLVKHAGTILIVFGGVYAAVGSYFVSEGVAINTLDRVAKKAEKMQERTDD